MQRPLSACSMILVFASFCTGQAFADTFSVTYRAPTDCLSREELVDQIRARTAHATHVERAGSFAFDVSLERVPKNKVVASLAVRSPSGKSSRRTLDGGSCQEIIAATAVIIALAIDPDARSGPIETARPEPKQGDAERSRGTTALAPADAGAAAPSGDSSSTTSKPAPGTARFDDSAPSAARANSARFDDSVPANTGANTVSGLAGAPMPSASNSRTRAASSAVDTSAEATDRARGAARAARRDTTSVSRTANEIAATRAGTVHATGSDGTTSAVAAPAQTKSAEKLLWSGRFSVGIDGALISALAPRFGMLRVGPFLSYRSLEGPIVTLAASWGPKARKRGESGIEAEFGYFGGALELGWKLISFQGLRIDAVSVISIGQLSAEAARSARVTETRRFNATWLAGAPGLQFGMDANWGGLSLQATAPISLIQPQFFIQAADASTREVFTVPTAGVQVSMRLEIILAG